MHRDIRQDITARLIQGYGFKQKGQWLQQGQCPSCGKKEAFVHAENPWAIQCGRHNKCGETTRIKELFPDLFNEFNKRYPANHHNPNATADAYMSTVRGFDINTIKSWYSQGFFKHPQGDKSTATIRFHITDSTYMERLIEPVTTIEDNGDRRTRKANFKGSFKHLCWHPPTMQVEKNDEIWIVEGCFDAIALYFQGIKAIAILSCVNFPKAFIEKHHDKNITYVWALDNDKAGKEHIKIHVKRCKDNHAIITTAATIPAKLGKIDWNDCHILNKLNDTFLNECRFHGQLLLAGSALEKAILIWERFEVKGFCIDYGYRTYWFDYNLKEINASLREKHTSFAELSKDKKSIIIKQFGILTTIANCQISFLYFLKDNITEDSWYYARIDSPIARKAIKSTFTGAQVSSASEFKKRLLSVAPGALFSGESKHLDWLIRTHLHAIKTVETIDYVGYSKDHQAYIFDKLAFSKGRAYTINEEDFFELNKISVKSLNQSLKLTIGSASQYKPKWSELLWQAFGVKGYVALSFWLGTLFAEHIRQTQQSYPFLEIVGEPGSGKTTLLEFLWKLVGRADEEGFDPSKATAAALSRKFSQVSNLPVVLIEGDRDADSLRSKRFDYDELKTAYNGRASRVRGIKNSGLDTYEPPFRGSIVISQNTSVNASEAILQRIVHCEFTKARHCLESKQAADTLNLLPVEQVSYFLHLALTHESKIMQVFHEHQYLYEKELLQNPEIKSVRIAKNHAQILALTHCLSVLINIPTQYMNEIQNYIMAMAKERQLAIAMDHPIVAAFWEIYDYVNQRDETSRVNHAINEDLIAISLNHFVAIAKTYNQQVPLIEDLKKHLRDSKSHRFVAFKAVYSSIENRTIKCWVFTKEGVR